MAKDDLSADYWQNRYDSGTDAWDLGAPSRPLQEYIDQLTDKNLRILIPGCGRAWEGQYLHAHGFHNVWLMDLTGGPFSGFLQRCPDFPQEHLLVGDFFEHSGQYNRIIEQTFFCAIDPTLRPRYVEQMHNLLAPGGKLVGVLFNDKLNDDKPPFGGSEPEYRPLFQKWFDSPVLEPCNNSIPPRAGRELWLSASKAKDGQ